MGRRRGRPRGSTKPMLANKAAAKPKPKHAKSARQIPAAPTPEPDQEQPTTEQPVASATTPTVAGEEEEEAEEAVGTSSEGAEQEKGEDEEEVEYAATDLPGVRFHPTDTELIGYLRRKYGGRRMPADIVKDFNVFQHHPSTVQEICGDSIDGSWYVFTPRNRKYEDGSRPDRSVICEGNNKIGYWKSNVKETDITVGGKVIGKTNALTFALGNQPKGELTRWRMKEYRIPDNRRKRDPKRRKPSQRILDPDDMLLDEWVICKLFYNKNKKDQDGAPVDVGGQQDGEVNEDADEEADGKDDDTDDGNPPSDGHEDADEEADGKDDDTNDGIHHQMDMKTPMKKPVAKTTTQTMGIHHQMNMKILYMVPFSTNDFAFEDQ
ncbi:hypothetical protein BRADI_1g20063v3 [Brachypodium distachyon]|uniref:NAC domain-containing protein n=2 Tax=Brachypodium distachyon TaxID=15368 RepID=A0A2K2DK63_BRADI|nr:hypothetical protein BRADI_1g20063v3 [Brachypodium distachyon]